MGAATSNTRVAPARGSAGQVDALLYQCSVDEAIRVLLFGRIQTRVERSGAYNADVGTYPGVCLSVLFRWLREAPVLSEDATYRVLDTEGEGSRLEKIAPVTLVFSAALLERPDYHINVAPDDDASRPHQRGQHVRSAPRAPADRALLPRASRGLHERPGHLPPRRADRTTCRPSGSTRRRRGTSSSAASSRASAPTGR